MPNPDRSTTKPLAGTVFYVLLALADRPRYGLDIAREVSGRTDGDVNLGPGTLYNAVKKMLDQGLIEETEAAPDSDVDERSGSPDPRRRYYRITPAGRAAVRSEARRLDRLIHAVRAKHILPGGSEG